MPEVRVSRITTWTDEGNNVTFAASRSGSTEDTLDARLSLFRKRSRVTAADLSDSTLGVTTSETLIQFDDEEITVSFPVGTTSVLITRPTTDDSFNYGNSTYHASVLAGPDDEYTAVNDSSTKVWVQDDDRPTVTVTAPTTEFYGYSQQVYPGQALSIEPGYLSVSLTRTGDSSGGISILAKIPGYTEYWPAPEQNKDFEPLLFDRGVDWYIPPGETSFAIQFRSQGSYTSALGRSATFTLAPNDHYCPDDPAACGYGPQYTLGTPQEATVRLYNNFMGVRIEADQTTVAEGGTAAFTLHRHGGKPDAMSRPLHVNVGVTQKGDYISGATPVAVTFLAGQATTTLSVPTSNDSVDEPDGAIRAKILEADRYDDDEYAYIVAHYPGTPWLVYSATTAVTDDDYFLPNLSLPNYEVDEDQGTLNFLTSMDGPNYDNPVSFDWTTRDDGSATAGTDYQTESGSSTILRGQTKLLLDIAITNDIVPEPDETFSIVLSNPSNANPGGATATVTIHDDELDFGVTIFETIWGI